LIAKICLCTGLAPLRDDWTSGNGGRLFRHGLAASARSRGLAVSYPLRRRSGSSRSKSRRLLSGRWLKIAASGRRTRRRGSQGSTSLNVSPGTEAFPEGTLEIALVCTGR
jgi:hypothetical protein